MSLLSSILGPLSGKDTADQKTSSTTDQKTKQTQAQVSAEETSKTAAQTSEQQSQQAGEIRLLDPESEAALKQIFLQLAGDFTGGGGSAVPPNVATASDETLDFARALRERAGGAEGVVAANSGAIVGEARRLGENALEAQGTRLGQATGSNINSIIQAINAQGRGDLESQLGALSADLAIRGRQLGSEELATAFGASAEATRTGADVALAGEQTGVQNIAQIVAALRGATTTSQQTGATTGAATEDVQIQSLVEALSELLQETTATQKGKTSGKSSSTPGLFDILAIPGILTE